MSSPAAAERAALLALLSDLGPGAPTLCEGWTAHELAAHLVARERRPQAMPGILLPPLHPVTAFFERRQADRAFQDLLGDLQDGPPPWSPARWSEVGELHEWFVHHEDVRRAVDPGPRDASPDLDDALWLRLAVFGPVNTLRAQGLGLTLATSDGRSRRVRRGAQEVLVLGEPAELTMWVFGRRSAAEVVLDGAPDAVEAAQRFPLGV